MKKGLLNKLIFPITGALFFSGCYTHMHIKEPPVPRRIILYNDAHYLDYDGDGIPNIFDPHPFIPNHHHYFYYSFPYNPSYPYYKAPRDKINIKSQPPRTKEGEKQRNNDGGRNNNRNSDSGRKR